MANHEWPIQRLCCACGRLGVQLLAVPPGLVRGAGTGEGEPVQPGFYHGVCVVDVLSCEDIAALPRAESAKLRLNECGPTLVVMLLQAWDAPRGVAHG